MFGRVLIAISCFIFVFALSAEANDFDKCRVGANSSIEVQLSNLQKSPYLKKGEFLRTKLYSKGQNPLITINSSGQTITFGIFKNSSSFALYKSLKDYSVSRNPCDSVNSSIFLKNDFLDINVMVEDNGLFSVVVGGEYGFILSCYTGYKFKSSSKDSIVIGMERNFLYDCA